MRTPIVYSLAVSLFGMPLGCAILDPASVRATSGAPASAHVDEFRVPFNPEMPRFVLAVEPVRFTGAARTTIDEFHVVQSESGSGKLNHNLESASGSTTDTQTTHGGSTVAGSVRRSVTAPEQAQAGGPARSNGVRNVALENEGGAGAQGLSAEFSNTQTGGKENSTAVTTARTNGKGTMALNTKRNLERTVTRSTTTYSEEEELRQRQITAQLTTALASVENFSLIDAGRSGRAAERHYTSKLRHGEKGPYIVRALITEYEARAELESKKTRIPLFGSSSSEDQHGVVALDVSIVDQSSGRMVSSFPVRGTFSSKDLRSRAGFIVPVNERRHFAQSVADQALRVAINDAARKCLEVLGRE